MTPEDKLVWRILKTCKPEYERKIGKKVDLEDSSDDDENISRFEFVNNFLKYKNSFKKFKVSPEEVFSILNYRVRLQEQTSKPDQETIETVPEETKIGIDYISLLPVELKLLIVKFTGPKGYFKSVALSQAWRYTMNSADSKVKQKMLHSLMKQYCFATWPSHLCQASRKFLEQFGSFRNMLQFRPKVRFDGLYMCKLTYYRKGLSEVSERNPIHEVISYRYVRYLKDGTTIST